MKSHKSVTNSTYGFDLLYRVDNVWTSGGIESFEAAAVPVLPPSATFDKGFEGLGQKNNHVEQKGAVQLKRAK